MNSRSSRPDSSASDFRTALSASLERNARHAAKVLLKFYLLEVRKVTMRDLVAHVAGARYFRVINERYFRMPFEDFVRQQVACKTPNNTKLATGGLPPSPVAGVVLIDGKKVPFIIGGGTRGSSFSPEEPKPAVSPVRQRQFWHINNANR